jgi:phenylpyruvate tautomerase PptA (4-oxalocrotonate tautomerase family)
VTTVPLLNVRTSASAFPQAAVDALITRLTAAAWRAESIPDTPAARLRALAVHQEIPAGRCYAGGLPADALVALVLVEFTAADGVLDPVRRAGFAADLERAAAETLAEIAHDGDSVTRRLVTSVTFTEVPEGRWGRGGEIVRLPQMAAAAGFEHLAAIAAR